MGFFDKIKEKAKEIKENNKNFGATMKRMNDRARFCGNVNVKVKDGDFVYGSYLNIEPSGDSGVIYSTSQDDYVFKKENIAEFNLLGDGMDIAVGDQKRKSLRYEIKFTDGKRAECDIIVLQQLDKFKSALGLN